MSEEIVRQWDISTTHGITANTGDDIDMKTNNVNAQATLRLDPSRPSPFADGAMTFQVNNQGTTKQVASSASGDYPVTVNQNPGWNIHVDTDLPVKKLEV